MNLPPLLVLFLGTLGDTQNLLLALTSEIIPGGLEGPYRMQGLNLGHLCAREVPDPL